MNTQELSEKAKELIHQEVKEYLTWGVVRYSEEYNDQIKWTIAEYFYDIENILKDKHSDCDSLEVSSFEGPMRAMYILVQCVLEEVLPKVYLKPEWVRDSDWKKMLNKKENTND
jgi:hypothetical protein